MGWNYLSIPKPTRFHRWSMGINKWFYATLYNGCSNLSMLELKLNHVKKRSPGGKDITRMVERSRLSWSWPPKLPGTWLGQTGVYASNISLESCWCVATQWAKASANILVSFFRKCPVSAPAGWPSFLSFCLQCVRKYVLAESAKPLLPANVNGFMQNWTMDETQM